MKPQSIVYIVSDITKALHFEWVAERINRHHFQLSFILIGKLDTPLAQALKALDISIVQYKTHMKWQLPWLIIKVWNDLRRIKPSVVHTHMLTANLAGLTAAWLARVPKRVFTRHHALVHHEDYKKGLLWDKWFAFVASHIIAVSKSIESILIERENVVSAKVILIHHGFNLDYFTRVSDERMNRLKLSWKLEGHHPVVGVIARYQYWKGIQYIIPAFQQLLREFPSAKLVLANAQGAFANELKSLLQALPVNSFIEIPFENDLVALYRVMDVYVHVPISSAHEAFGQTYIEALASEVPSVFTLSGVATEFIVDRKNALVVPFKDSEAIYQAVKEILTNQPLCSTLRTEGLQSTRQFSLEKMIIQLENLYG